MSELKVINAYRLTTNTEDSDVYIHNDEFGCGGDLVECYLKSEVDKVIAEKDKQIEELKHQRDGAFGLTNLGLTLEDLTKLARKQIDYQKYKRCLRNAEGCLNKVWYYTEVHDCSASNRMWKWRQRWLELAEKFKEAK